jgi:glycosyltransferase involved in cell wall biosynthesis
MPDKKNKTVCLISARHPLFDDRIYKKEAITLAHNGYDVVHIGYGNCFEDYYTTDAIRIIQIKKTRIKQITLNDLFQAAKTVSATVYHLHDVELCRIALKLKKLPWRPKVIYDAHEPFIDNLKDYWRERSLTKVLFNDIPSILAEKRILRKMDYLIATEENVASRFRKHNPRTAIIYNYSYFSPSLIGSRQTSFLPKGADQKRCHPALDAGSPDNQSAVIRGLRVKPAMTSLSEGLYGQSLKEFDAVYCGSVTKSKGIFLILDALIAVKKRGIDFKVAIVGSISNQQTQSEVEAIIRREKLTDNLFFTGKLPLEEVSLYYEKSKIAFCLFPFNRTNQLILPIKLFEYAAFGLPIIGSNFGHIATIIQSDEIGVCVDPHDAEKIADAFIDLMTGDEYKKYIPACIRCVENKYLWKTQEPELLHIYEELLDLSGKIE